MNRPTAALRLSSKTGSQNGNKSLNNERNNMNNRRGKNRLIHLLALLALPMLMTFAGRTVEAAGLRLIYSNDNLGELAGCG
jgi:hypothetical protein